jgi:hypothetical protein
MTEALNHQADDISEALLAEGVMSLADYCAKFDTSRAQAYRDMDSGLLPYVIHGRRRKIPVVAARRMYAAALRSGAQG